MTERNKKIDEFLDQKLRRSILVQPRDDFSQLLMQKVTLEHKRLTEENKKERIVKYVLGSFSTFMIGFTIVMGYLYGKAESTATGSVYDVNTTVERSNSLVGRLVTAVQTFFLYVLNFFGVSISATTLNIALIIILVIGIYLIGERLFLRGKYKSSLNIAKR
ncbi:MAG TPA: hypothetical protein VGK25_09205 [Ignavibacteria bacterium]|jgi:hypothetical protein